MKSHVSDLAELLHCIYKDVCSACAVEQPDLRDLETIRSRVKHEGLSFLTITLPQFGADFERSLAEERIDSTLFRSFRKNGQIPAFWQGIVSLVFDQGTGRIYNEPNIAAIDGIRQMSYAFKKLNIACSNSRSKNAINGFVENEQIFEVDLDPGDIDTFVSISDILWSTTLGDISPWDCTPKHGPGSTVEGITGNQKFLHRRWHARLEPYFPLFHNAFSSENAFESEEFEKVSDVPADCEQPVKVITVPKTLKGPRIIAIEPVCMQYAQQAISRTLVKVLERSHLTQGHVNFTDQSVNRELALNASRDGKMSTIDLSSASDRVPLSLSMRMFDCNPDLQGAIFSCRSRRAKLPNGDILHLKKFASMGSALCFPVEAMYFYTICIAALIEKRNLPVTFHTIRKVSRDVYVYGDDIIIPTDDAAFVADYLSKYYLKVNENKSFWTGKFRESCGLDAYDGYVVTPTYVRHMRPSNKRDPKALISWCKASNNFFRRGYWKTADFMIRIVESITGELPVVGDRCAGLGKVSFVPYVSSSRWNHRYQRPEVRTWVACPVYRKDILDGYSALTKCLLSLEESAEPLNDKSHLSKTARYGAVTLKRRWTSPY
jgi:hypothetical protein